MRRPLLAALGRALALVLLVLAPLLVSSAPASALVAGPEGAGGSGCPLAQPDLAVTGQSLVRPDEVPLPGATRATTPDPRAAAPTPTGTDDGPVLPPAAGLPPAAAASSPVATTPDVPVATDGARPSGRAPPAPAHLATAHRMSLS